MINSRHLQYAFVVLATTWTTASLAAKSNQWQGEIPAVAQKLDDWKSLLDDMDAKGLPLGRMAAATRILEFFNEIEAKEVAFHTIIDLADLGYPSPVYHLFITADLLPTGSAEFLSDFNLYKFILNDERGLKKWAEHYLEGVDKKNSSKYLFYLAIEAIAHSKYKVGQDYLRQILAKEPTPEQRSFYIKVARTLARSYFDKEDYDKAYDIYSNFLLKLNPIEPHDWLEASWSLYYMHRYDESLGLVYNLESKSGLPAGNLEKFTLRALIYKNVCAVPSVEALLDNFEKIYGATLNAIKRGERLSQLAELQKLDIAENQEFHRVDNILHGLEEESTRIKDLDDKHRPLAEYLYKSELNILRVKHQSLLIQALEDSAKRLILTNERLRFLKFDVQREQHNPDLVFREITPTQSPFIEALANDQFLIKWEQTGIYWRDERNKYRGIFTSKCE